MGLHPFQPFLLETLGISHCPWGPMLDSKPGARDGVVAWTLLQWNSALLPALQFFPWPDMCAMAKQVNPTKKNPQVYEIVFVTSMVMVLMTPSWWVTGFMALGLPSIKHGDGFHELMIFPVPFQCPSPNWGISHGMPWRWGSGAASWMKPASFFGVDSEAARI